MSRKHLLPIIVCIVTILGLLPTLHGAVASLECGLSLTASRGIVGSTVGIYLLAIPAGDSVEILWDGRSVLTVGIDPATGFGSSSLKVPAATKGVHTVSARRGTAIIDSKPFEVVPRIKLIPNMAGWGDQVNVSLRGYAPWTIVRIRWLRDSTWVEVARTSTSKTGSANMYVTVPSWAAVGFNSIRGDAVSLNGGRAQTNAFRADRLIYVDDPIETLRPIEESPQPASPTPAEIVQPTASAPPTNTPNAEPTPAGTPVAQASG